MKRQHQKFEIDTIRFENLSFTYDDGNAVFNNVNFDFPTNSNVWIRAEHSGGGRSTLLQIIAGLLPVSQGKYLLNGKDVQDMTFEEFLPYRLSIGYTFDMGGLLHNRTLLENLTLPLVYHKVFSESEATERAKELMDHMGILKHHQQRPSSAQGSVRKLVCLLRPLLLNPQVMLLDDPSYALSQDVLLKYFDLIEQQKKNNGLKHVFISSMDEKLMGVLLHEEVCVGRGEIYTVDHPEMKKVVHL